MLRRLAKEASATAKAHVQGLTARPACSAASRARRPLSAPSPAFPPAAGKPARTGVSGSYSSGATAATSASATRYFGSTRLIFSSIPGGGKAPLPNKPEPQKVPPKNQEEAEKVIPTNEPEAEKVPPRNQQVLKEPTLQLPLHVTDINFSDPEDMSPDEYFAKRPILRKISNDYVTNLAGRSRWEFPDDSRETIFSLFEIMVVNHIDLIALGDALEEGNLRISWKTRKFKLKQRPTPFLLVPEREKQDCLSLHDLIVGFVEKQLGANGKEMLPFDAKDLLEKLKADCVNMKLILLHPFFMKWLDRVLFRILADQEVRIPSKNDKGLQAVLSKLPYAGPELMAIVSKNKSLSAWNKHRDKEQKKWDSRKKNKKRGEDEEGETEEEEETGEEEEETEEEEPTVSITLPPAKKKKFAKWKNRKKNRKGREAPPAAITPLPALTDQELEELKKKIADGRRLIALNRDGINHKNLKSLKKIIQMLQFEFPSFECKLLDLLDTAGKWKVMEMAMILKVSERMIEALEKGDSKRHARYLLELQGRGKAPKE